MNYSFLISDMRWSYSRIKIYEDCPYKFYLKYIEGERGQDMFFSSYGTFMHDIIKKFHKKELKKNELVSYYLLHYEDEVRGRPMSSNVYINYFNAGLVYLRNIQEDKDEIVACEEEFSWKIGDYRFIGFADLITKDCNGDYKIIDNKSKDLKNRSNRKKETLGDKELDDYLRQLYLYSSALKSTFHCIPKYLEFNCYRTGKVITEPYVEEKHLEAEKWATDSIEKIKKEEDWRPHLDDFSCKYICDVNHACEYYNMNRRR